MKILIVTDQFPSISTPFILNIITGLIDKEHEVSVVSCSEGDYQNTHHKYLYYKDKIKVYTIDKIPQSIFIRYLFALKNTNFLRLKEVLRIIKAFNFFKNGRHAFSGRYFYECLMFSNLGDFDLIHAQFGPNGVMLNRLKKDRFVKAPFITHFRGYDLSKLFRFEPSNYYHKLFKEGDFFIANCNYFLNKIIALGAPKDRSRVVYSGIDENVFTKTKEYNGEGNPIIRLCSVSRLSGKKGLEFNLKALAKVRELRPEIKFEYNIIGDGEKKSELENLAADLTLTNCIHFYGSRNHTFINDFLPSQDIFLSHNITSDEGDQDAPVNVIKEAFLIKLPVISTFHGGIPELVVDNYSGFLVHERDFISLATKIIDLCDNYYLRKKFAENGQKIVKEKFLNTIINQQLLETYKLVIGYHNNHSF